MGLARHSDVAARVRNDSACACVTEIPIVPVDPWSCGRKSISLTFLICSLPVCVWRRIMIGSEHMFCAAIEERLLRSSPEEFAILIACEIACWTNVVQDAHIQIQ